MGNADYTIKFDPVQSMARMSIDSACHQAVTRFRDQLGDDEGLAHRIARAAAENAVEFFKTMCNAELRLIAIEHEQRARELMLKPSSIRFP